MKQVLLFASLYKTYFAMAATTQKNRTHNIKHKT